MEDKEDERYRPGLLDLNLQISVVGNFHHLKYQLQLTKKLEEEFKDFPTTLCAILNLRGAVQFFLRDYGKACETFKEVLRIDESNLNALRNLEIIHRQLGCWSEADKYQNTHGKSIDATCYGEQGFAIMFDCHVSSNEYERFKRAEKLFQLCLGKVEEKGIENYAVLEWRLWYGQLLHRLMNHCTKEYQKEKKVSCWIEGIKQCLIVKQNFSERSEEKKHLISVAEAYVAIFSHKVDSKLKGKILSEFSDLEESVSTEQDKMLEEQVAILKSLPDEAVKELVSALQDPNKVFESAVELHQNTEVLCRHALFIRGRTDVTLADLNKAEKSIDMCIAGENGGNWFAFSIKSGIVLSKCKRRYKKNMEENCKIQDQYPDSEEECKDETTNAVSQSEVNTGVWHTTLEKWLTESIKYGMKAGEINATSQIFSELGEAYHWQALNQKDVTKKNEYFFEALANFLHALQHAEGNKKPFVHICHAECLFDMQEYLPALESFKRAIECGTKKLEETYLKLFECYIELQKNIDDTDNQLFSDIAYWIRLGNDKFKSKGCWLDEILKQLKERKQGDTVKIAEIHKIFANAARELHDRESFPVSEEYLNDNVNFALCLFGETLQLQNKAYSESCIKMLDEEKLMCLSEDPNKELMCKQNVAKAFTTYKELCFKSPAKDYLKEEAFLMGSFKQLYGKCRKFAEAVAEEIKANHPLLGNLLLCRAGKHPSEMELPDSPVKDMSLRELTFCLKKLDYKEETDQEKFKACIEAFEQYIEKLSNGQDSQAGVRHDLLPEPRNRKKQYEYDFTVLFSEEDSQWVVHSLLPTLEKKYGFKGYVENRDMLPGQSKFNILDIFKKCYKVIVILTDNFCQDRWCYFLFQHALSGKLGEHNIIPIQKSRLKDIPKELTTINSLTAVQNLDWERLVQVLG